MKRATHEKELLFATSFSWWSRGSAAGRQPASAGLSNSREARLKPAQQIKFSPIRPPTEVGGKQHTCGNIAMHS
jgi:hypothetical protein